MENTKKNVEEIKKDVQSLQTKVMNIQEIAKYGELMDSLTVVEKLLQEIGNTMEKY